MSTSTGSKTITLNPSWKHYFAGYFFAILAIPLLGIGFVIFYFVRKKHRETSYKVTDDKISSINNEYQRNIDLVNIESIDVEQSWLNKKLGVGTLILHTSASEMEITGMENPENLKTIIERAIEAEKAQLKKKKDAKPREPQYDPGSMERMNYLTGLWQEGLISDEEYEQERKHFE